MNSELFVGTRVTASILAISRFTRSSPRQPGVLHHVVCDVRISEVSGTNSSPFRPPDAVDRSKRPSACSSSASTSSGCTKFSSVSTGGSVESSCGSYCAKFESASENVSAIAPGGTAGWSSGSIGQRTL